MNTTISVSTEIRDKLQEFGTKGETYTDILWKLYQSAKERQLYDLLMNEDDSVPIGDALARAKETWPE